jgi:uncharacterized membrane protein YeaQ/YmgE (transglycosylase-associated protein family)
LGLIGDIVVALIGAVIGGYLLSALGIEIGEGYFGAVVAAVIGAVILLVIVRLVRRLT